MFENKEKSDLNTLGEFGLIKHLTGPFKNNQPATFLGIGDDTAVIANPNTLTLATSDMLVEGVHFDLSYTPLKHLGYKAVTSNLSDIAAMNGVPTQILVSIGLSSKISLEAIEEVYAGIKAACDHYNVDLIGGDTTSTRSGLVISITALGQAKEEELVYRKGAKESELLCVTGDLGAAYTGLMLLEREKRIFLENPQVQPDMQGHDYILQRQLRPEARTDMKAVFEELIIKPSAMIDISDGLSSELFHLAAHSHIGFVVYEDKLPIDPTTFQTARDLGLDPTVCALNGGEDYELLFTLPQSDYEKVKTHADISIIGYVTDSGEGIHLMSKAGNKHAIKAQGWTSV